jgi:hypothetical protein
MASERQLMISVIPVGMLERVITDQMIPYQDKSSHLKLERFSNGLIYRT